MPFNVQRTFAAPPEQVWAAWTVPEQLSKWYNPAPGEGCRIESQDLRPGGAYRRVMPRPDGGEHVDEGVFFVVEPPRRLVQGTPDKAFLIHTDLEPHNGGTRMTLGMDGTPPEQAEHMRAAWGAGFDKLDALLKGGA